MILPNELRDVIDKYDQQAWEGPLKELTTELDARTPPAVIYHYTDDAGLHGILKSGKLWLTDIFDLDDPSELKHGFSYAVEELDKRSQGTSEEIQLFARNFRLFFTDIEEAGHFFVCCFSSCGDDLGQWPPVATGMHPIGKNAFWKELSVRHAANAVRVITGSTHSAN
jgi:hypothetical protein